MNPGGGDEQRPEVLRLAAVLSGVAADLVAAPAWSLDVAGKMDALVAVETAGRAVEAARLAVIRALDGDDLKPVGAASLAGLLTTRCKIGPGRAKADVAAARATDPDAAATAAVVGTRALGERGALPGMGRALLAGQVSRPHLDVAVRTLEKVPTEMRAGAAAAVDQFFVEESVKYPPREMESLAADLLDRLDPERHDRCYDPDAFTRRRFDMVEDSTGMLVVRGQLDPATGAQLKAAVEHFAAPDPTTRDEQGLPVADPRTPSQRRADALGLIATRALANAGSKGGEPPRVVVHVTVDQLLALQDGDNLGEQTAAGRAWCEQLGFLTPDTLARLGCSALFERVLTARNGAPLNLGRSARLASDAQRRALAARDRHCVIPGCTRPATQCDAHHITSWVTGGLTDIDEMVLACTPHHNAIHAGVYQIVMKDKIPWVRTAGSPVLARNTLPEDTARARKVGTQILLDLDLDLDLDTLKRRRHRKSGRIWKRPADSMKRSQTGQTKPRVTNPSKAAPAQKDAAHKNPAPKDPEPKEAQPPGSPDSALPTKPPDDDVA